MRIVVLSFCFLAFTFNALAFDNNNLYCNELYRFCINFPPGWTVIDGTRHNVVKKAVDGKGGNLNINVIVAERNLNRKDIDEIFTYEYLDELKNSLNAVMDGFYIVSKNKIDLGGERALYVKYKGSIAGNGINANLTGIAVISGHSNYMLRITGGGLSENYNFTEPALLKSISTFRYTDKKSKTLK